MKWAIPSVNNLSVPRVRSGERQLAHWRQIQISCDPAVQLFRTSRDFSSSPTTDNQIGKYRNWKSGSQDVYTVLKLAHRLRSIFLSPKSRIAPGKLGLANPSNGDFGTHHPLNRVSVLTRAIPANRSLVVWGLG